MSKISAKKQIIEVLTGQPTGDTYKTAFITALDEITAIGDVLRKYPSPDCYAGELTDCDYYYEVRYASYGNYDDSGAVERANNRYLQEKYSTWFHNIHGVYSSVACCITDEIIDGMDWNNTDVREQVTEIIDLLNALHDYPVIDEELMGEMEEEKIAEVIKECYARDVQRAIEQRFDDAIEVPEEKRVELIRKFAVGKFEPHFESGGNVYIDINKILPLIMEEIDDNSIITGEWNVPQSVIDAVDRNNGTACLLEWLPVAHDIAAAMATGSGRVVVEYGDADIDGMVPVTVMEINI